MALARNAPTLRLRWEAGEKNQPDAVGFLNSGGEEEDRTPDLRIANATLSQLSYFPFGWVDVVYIRSELIAHEAEIGVFGVGLDDEAQSPHKLEHVGVVGEDKAHDFAQALFAGDVHDAAHEA